MNRRDIRETRRIQTEHVLANKFALIAIPELSSEFPLINITRVELTSDRKDGVIWITAAESVNHQDLVTVFQSRILGWRRTIRSKLNLKYFPNLKVKYDEGQADIIKIEKLLTKFHD